MCEWRRGGPVKVALKLFYDENTFRLRISNVSIQEQGRTRKDGTPSRLLKIHTIPVPLTSWNSTDVKGQEQANSRAASGLISARFVFLIPPTKTNYIGSGGAAAAFSGPAPFPGNSFAAIMWERMNGGREQLCPPLLTSAAPNKQTAMPDLKSTV